MKCASCSFENPPSGVFCSRCGAQLAAENAPAAAPARTGSSSRTAADWANEILEAFKDQWRGNIWFRVLSIGFLIFLLLTGDPRVVVVVILVGVGMRLLAPRLEEPLASFWPVRDRLPGRLRTILMWVTPLVTCYWIAMQPSLVLALGGLPFLGPDASRLAFLSSFSALIVYLLIHEPGRQRAAS
jgi:hypothetical protein